MEFGKKRSRPCPALQGSGGTARSLIFFFFKPSASIAHSWGLSPATHVGWAITIVLVAAFVGLNVRWWERREAVVTPGVLYRSGQLHGAELLFVSVWRTGAHDY